MKRAAGIEACNYIKSGMTIGLGTGSTIKYTILELAKRITEGELEGITAIPTSIQTEELALKHNITLTDWAQFTEDLDLTIDGADEIDP
jgi:ribose 5-phosphate isomerase A